MRHTAASFVVMLGVALCADGALASDAPLADTSMVTTPTANTSSAAATASPDDSTPLQWAVYRDDAAEVKRLLAAGALVSAANDYGVTAMQLAAETANTDIIQMLLKAGADVESANAEGQTALMSVARTSNVAAATLLIKHGANVNAAEHFGGQTALMWAAARRHPEMVELLLAQGAHVNARATVRDFERHITVEQRYKNTHTGGLTPLLYAVRENCKACVESMLRHHAEILLPDPDGIAPLTLAMMNGNWDIAKRLLAAGADVNQWDIYGQSPLHVAIENAYVGRTGAVNYGSDKAPNDTDGKDVVRMLVERGADPNQQMFFRPPKEHGQVSTSARGTTPFQRACASLDVDLIQYLLAHGADAKLATAAGETSMMVAIEGRGTEDQVIAVLHVLKDAGADVNGVQKILYITRDHGGTALHAATKKGLKKVMAELVALGANPDIKDEDGLTALDYAMSRGWLPALNTRPPPRTDLVKVLRGLGATVELAKTPDWPGEFPPIGPPRGRESVIWPL
ncbi:MAG: ankyrin repeat domain-containing protein [Pseudomonadota bacterium]